MSTGRRVPMLERQYNPSKRQLSTSQKGVTTQKVWIFLCILNLSRSHAQSGSEAHDEHRTSKFTYHTIRRLNCKKSHEVETYI
jgi:hypothetical protein